MDTGRYQRVRDNRFVSVGLCVARSGSRDTTGYAATFVREIRLVRPLSIIAGESFWRASSKKFFFDDRTAVRVMGYREAECSVATLAS